MRNYNIQDNLLDNIDEITKERWLNAIYNYVERHPFYNQYYYWKFYYDESKNVYDDDCLVNVYQLMKNYPYQVIDRIDHIMINLSRTFPRLSDTFNIRYIKDNYSRLFYCETNNNLSWELKSIFSALEKIQYIEVVQDHNQEDLIDYRISIDGWKRIAELTKNQSVYNYGFIAMAFDEKVEYIKEIFKKAIQAKGYEPRIINEKEHNNYIMLEIFYEIQKSKFVVDVTEPNHGAYFEAGYAQALGKEVIVCCKEEVFKGRETKPHFDIAQKSMILWKDENDLYDRLKRRIEVTVK